jgi:hypothetical protein
MRHAALDSRRRARLLAAALLALATAAACLWAVSDRPERAAAQSATCTGDGSATATVTDPDHDGAGETAVDTAIPASCDLGLRSDGRTGRFWSIDVYDSADASKRYFCHRGTDAPPGEPACPTPQPTNPPDSDVTASIVRENGSWRLYLHVNTRQPNLSLGLRAHYAWKGSGPSEPDQCPSEPGTGPCETPPPAGSRFDLAVTLKTVFGIEPADRLVPVTLTVRNTQRAQTRSPASTLLLSVLTDNGGQLGRVELGDVKFGDAPLVDCAPVENSDQFIRCTVPSLSRDAGLDVPLQVPATAERISLLGVVAAGRCTDTQEIGCDNNTTSEYNVNVPAPDTKIEPPDLSNTPELFFEGSSSRSKPLEVAQVARARAAATAPRVRRVEIAALRSGGRARAAAVPRCLWLRNGRGDFRRVRAGAKNRCDEPVWLRVRGTRRWRFEGSKPLPKGRYVVYARAVDAAGHTTSIFTKRQRNRFAFEVR